MNAARTRVLARRIPVFSRSGDPWTLAEDRALLRRHTALVAAGADPWQLWIKLARKHARTPLAVQGRHYQLTRFAERIRAL